ncbi:MAG: hypothetical protein ACLQLG_07160 [Thermoguttaceae bacterium]
METIEFRVTGHIWWRLTGRETVSAPVPALGEWSVVSPLATPDGEGRGRVRDLFPFSDGTQLFSTDRLILRANAHEKSIDQNVKELGQLLPGYLNALRFVCRQPELARSISSAFARGEVAELKAPDRLPTVGEGKQWVRRYLAESAVRWEALTDASNCVIGGKVPVHGELVNDAAEAIAHSNYRSSIIFSAMAAESCAGAVLDREYDRRLGETPQSLSHRYVTIQVSRQERVTKDPVFLALRAGGGDGRGRFLRLLHECPLYLLGKSLQLDQPTTYSNAHSLYRTRNSLAHTGTTEIGKAQLLPVSYDGAITALKTANAVLGWFGESGTCIPSNEFIETGPWR